MYDIPKRPPFIYMMKAKALRSFEDNWHLLDDEYKVKFLIQSYRVFYQESRKPRQKFFG